MKALKIVVVVLVALFVFASLYGFYRTWKTGRMPEHARFVAGTVPTSLPTGQWIGHADELGKVSWVGKKFLGEGKGINAFEKDGVRSEAYPFTLVEASSIGFGGKKILKLDYDRPENPLWLRFIVDEMVSIGENEYLGVVYINFFPGAPFRMGYFRLEK
jgi:hypothetical protein